MTNTYPNKNEAAEEARKTQTLTQKATLAQQAQQQQVASKQEMGQ